MRKILLVFCMLFSSVSLWADDNEKFTSMAVKFISENRSIEVCELSTNNVISIKTKKGKTEKVLCIWLPYADKNVCYLNAEDAKKVNNVDFLLLGYGQSPTNSTFRYWIPASKVTKKLKIEKLDKYKMSCTLNDYMFQK